MAFTNNMQIHSGLTIRYAYDGKPYITTTESKVLYKITRIITKTYSVVGIGSYQTAKNITTQKLQQYERTKKGWYIVETGNGVNVDYRNMSYCVAEITPTHTSGCLWQVDINVNEKDEVWTFSSPSGNLSGYFPAIDPTDYDEPPANS